MRQVTAAGERPVASRTGGISWDARIDFQSGVGMCRLSLPRCVAVTSSSLCLWPFRWSLADLYRRRKLLFLATL
jgi:hypothetical protein